MQKITSQEFSCSCSFQPVFCSDFLQVGPKAPTRYCLFVFIPTRACVLFRTLIIRAKSENYEGVNTRISSRGSVVIQSNTTHRNDIITTSLTVALSPSHHLNGVPSSAAFALNLNVNILVGREYRVNMNTDEQYELSPELFIINILYELVLLRIKTIFNTKASPH